MFTWRATAEERRESLDGDELLPEVRQSSTQAITIYAPPESIWPWLVQMGCDRAGWYSYDRLDNGGRLSATEILPALQQIRIGQILPARPGSSDSFEILRIVSGRHLLLGAYLKLPSLRGLAWDHAAPKSFIRSTWGFYLRSGRDATRLVVRSRTIIQPRWAGVLTNAVMGPAHIFMQRKQLLSLKARAERLTSGHALRKT